MGNLTVANQLTILRIMLVPAFVLLVVYGYLGWALITFSVAGLTDALDGLIARSAGQRTSLGAWLDPMADKLLLVTTFIVTSVVVMFYNVRREYSLLIDVFVWMSLTLTVVSAVDYFFKLRRLINEPQR